MNIIVQRKEENGCSINFITIIREKKIELKDFTKKSLY